MEMKIWSKGSYQSVLVMKSRKVDYLYSFDPANPDSVDNNVGGINSVMKVGLTDKSALPIIFTSEYEDAESEFDVKWTQTPGQLKRSDKEHKLFATYLSTVLIMKTLQMTNQ